MIPVWITGKWKMGSVAGEAARAHIEAEAERTAVAALGAIGLPAEPSGRGKC